MRLLDVFRTQWVVGRVPIPVDEHGFTPEEAAGTMFEMALGGWEPISWDPVGSAVVLRRKETIREKAIRWLGSGTAASPSSQETGQHTESEGDVSQWSQADTQRVLREVQ